MLQSAEVRKEGRCLGWGYFCYGPKGKNYDAQLICRGSCQTVLFFVPGKDSVTRLFSLACVRY